MKPIKETIKGLINDYVKLGYTEKAVLNELKAVIYNEQIDRGLIR